MSSSKLSYIFIPAALLFVTTPVAAVEDLSPAEVQEENKIYQELEQQNRIKGGATEEYLDQTNAIFQEEQPTERQLQNDREAQEVLDQSNSNGQSSKKQNGSKAAQ
jgi:hypothetical protein